MTVPVRAMALALTVMIVNANLRLVGLLELMARFF
jgi:hypothetical protein